MACRKTLEILPECVCSSAKDLHDVKEASAMIRPAVMSKQYGNEDFLSDLIAQACGESLIRQDWMSELDAELNLYLVRYLTYFSLGVCSLHLPRIWQLQCR